MEDQDEWEHKLLPCMQDLGDGDARMSLLELEMMSAFGVPARTSNRDLVRHVLFPAAAACVRRAC